MCPNSLPLYSYSLFLKRGTNTGILEKIVTEILMWINGCPGFLCWTLRVHVSAGPCRFLMHLHDFHSDVKESDSQGCLETVARKFSHWVHDFKVKVGGHKRADLIFSPKKNCKGKTCFTIDLKSFNTSNTSIGAVRVRLYLAVKALWGEN